MTELGFALVFAGRQHEGLRIMEDGIHLFGGEPTGFLVRAQGKLGRAYLRARSPILAMEILSEAHDNAKRTGAMDQISRIDRLAARVAWVLERRPSDPG